MDEEIVKNLHEMNLTLSKIEKIAQYLDLSIYEKSNEINQDIRSELKIANSEIEKIHRYLCKIESSITSTLGQIETNNCFREEVYINKLLENLLKIKNDISLSSKILIFIAVLNSFVLIKYF
jgi:hypothetical protein